MYWFYIISTTNDISCCVLVLLSRLKLNWNLPFVPSDSGSIGGTSTIICGDGLLSASTLKFNETHKYITLTNEMVNSPMLIRLHLSRGDRRLLSIRLNRAVIKWVSFAQTRFSLLLFLLWWGCLEEFDLFIGTTVDVGSFIVVVEPLAVVDVGVDDTDDGNSNGCVTLSSFASSLSLSLSEYSMFVVLIFQITNNIISKWLYTHQELTFSFRYCIGSLWNISIQWSFSYGWNESYFVQKIMRLTGQTAETKLNANKILCVNLTMIFNLFFGKFLAIAILHNKLTIWQMKSQLATQLQS